MDMVPELADDILKDLLRSSWVVESARTRVYERWAESEPRFGTSAGRARRRAALVLSVLEGSGAKPDEALVAGHMGWLTNLAGDRPGEVGLGELFLARIGDWIDAHLAGFLDDGAEEFKALGDEEKAALVFPSELPPAPPFEPVETVQVEPPGAVRFRFAILGDLHFGSEGADQMVGAAIEDLNASGAELTIQLGDLTDRGNRSEFEEAIAALSKLDMPLTTMMGNHDVYSKDEERLSGREYYPTSFGRDPDGVLLEHKGMRLAVLDSVEHAASPFSAYNMTSGAFVDGPGGAIVRGALSVPQHEILAEVAAPDSGPAFVFLHHPPQPFTGFPPILFGLRDADSGRLHATVDSGNVWGVFAGHTHRNARTRNYGTVLAQEVGIPRDFPFGYALVDVTDQGYAYRFVQISDQDLLREAYRSATDIHRRYALGSSEERGFVWRKS